MCLMTDNLAIKLSDCRIPWLDSVLYSRPTTVYSIKKNHNSKLTIEEKKPVTIAPVAIASRRQFK